MPDNMGEGEVIFGFDRQRYYCIKEDCGEKVHAWAVVRLGGLDPQAAQTCAVHIHFYCQLHWEEREKTSQPRADIYLN